MRDDFAVFILSHGRADNVVTWASLDRSGYTGKRYIVIDTEDDQEQEYRRLFGDCVLQFDKREIEKTFDTFDNRDERRTVVFARNACFSLAKRVGVKYFLELDDDYTEFMLRYVEDDKFRAVCIRNIDKVIECFLEFLEASGALSVCFSQGGDFIGGHLSNPRWRQQVGRKAMNSFFCSVERPFTFLGRINEDVNTYTVEGSRGRLFFTIYRMMLCQQQTQKSDGGMTGAYLDSGTYVKSFYTVICMPSAVTISMVGQHKRIHHKISWNNVTPQIISDRYRKTE